MERPFKTQKAPHNRLTVLYNPSFPKTMALPPRLGIWFDDADIPGRQKSVKGKTGLNLFCYQRWVTLPGLGDSIFPWSPVLPIRGYLVPRMGLSRPLPIPQILCLSGRGELQGRGDAFMGGQLYPVAFHRNWLVTDLYS